MTLILLTSEQADQVRGLNADGTAELDPRETSGGMFVLGAQVLIDPAHAAHHALLAACPLVDVESVEFPPEE